MMSNSPLPSASFFIFARIYFETDNQISVRYFNTVHVPQLCRQKLTSY